MGSVRSAEEPLGAGVRSSVASPGRLARHGSGVPCELECLFVLDIVYVLGVIALFGLVGAIGKAVEKL